MTVSKKTAAAYDAVILLAHGTPDVLSEMPAYLEFVIGGRKVSPEVVHELQDRCAQISLSEVSTPESAHLTRWTLRVAELLERQLGQRVYVGMRNWKPFIRDVVDEMKRDGIKRAKDICLAPQNSRTSVGLFKRALEVAVNDSIHAEFISGWADPPILVRAFAQRLRAALVSVHTRENARVAVLFTAHSVPSRTVQLSPSPVEYHGIILATSPDTYKTDCRQTAALVAAEVKDIVCDQDWFFSFQSQGMSGEPWIGPAVEETLAQLKSTGYDTVVIQPVVFLCDHVEILYDIDIVFQKVAAELGLRLVRAESLNDSPLLIDALEDLALN